VIARPLRVGALVLAWLVALGCAAWAIGALVFDLPSAQMAGAGIFVIAVLGSVIFVSNPWRKIGCVMLAFAIVLAWWWTLRPSNNRPWQADVAETAWAEVNGDDVTLHNVRNCEYRTEIDYTPRWETRSIRLSQLAGLDLAITYWGSPYIAHPIASFQFADAPPVCFSIEVRKEIGESYSAVRGFYRQYELIYLVADERDVIRLRSDFRKGEEVYLYHLTTPPDKVRERFLEYIAALNELHTRPRWYNALTTNCTTAIRTQHAVAERAPWDWRILVNGKADEMLYERHALATGGLRFEELKKQAVIRKAPVSAAANGSDFSRRIRENRAGFSAAVPAN
jgi:hypothetical protein